MFCNSSNFKISKELKNKFKYFYDLGFNHKFSEWDVEVVKLDKNKITEYEWFPITLKTYFILLNRSYEQKINETNIMHKPFFRIREISRSNVFSLESFAIFSFNLGLLYSGLLSKEYTNEMIELLFEFKIHLIESHVINSCPKEKSHHNEFIKKKYLDFHHKLIRKNPNKEKS